MEEDFTPTFCRIASSMGELEGNLCKTWGLQKYKYRKDKYNPVVFVGLFDLRDYIALLRHKGEKIIFWCGSDITNLQQGFAFNNGKLRFLSKIFRGIPKPLIKYLQKNCQNYVQDGVMAEALDQMGIATDEIIPSFAGDVNDFPISFKVVKPYFGKMRTYAHVYVSAHPGREKEYGFHFMGKIAYQVPGVDFHFYGAKLPNELNAVPNIIGHGIIPKSQFNEEIKNYQCGLRLNKMDGTSEIMVKSILMGQWPITRISYPHVDCFKTEEELVGLLKQLKDKKEPNYEARKYYLERLNAYPWVRK